MSAEGPQASQKDELLSPAVPLRLFRDGTLVVPKEEDLQAVLAQAVDADKLVALQKLVSAHEEVARRCDLAFEESVRLVVFRLEVERKLGVELAQVDHRGGHGSKSTRLTSIRGGASDHLPGGITKQMAAKYRALAAIPEPLFRSYLESVRGQRRVPSANGARTFAADAVPVATGRPQRRVAQKASSSLPPVVVDAVGRFFGHIDVCVGDVGVQCGTRVSPDTVSSTRLRGRVFIAACNDPDRRLPELVRMRMAGKLIDVLVVLPAVTNAAWFGHLQDGWRCAFVVGSPALVLAYHGTRTEPFDVVMREVGVVMQAVRH